MIKAQLSLIVAMAQNRCIGKDGRMPWHISDDLKRFKTLTMGHPVIMGRKTFESIISYLGKPLPGRTNIVISRAGSSYYPDSSVFSTIEDAIDHAKTLGSAEVFIIGGAQIYAQTIDQADTIHLTQIHHDVEGDAFFPAFDRDNWREENRIDRPDHDPPYSYITLVRK